MNIQEMHETFNVLMDSYNEPYFTESEVDLFINNGQNQFVNDIIIPEYTPVVDQNDTGRQITSKIEGSSQVSEILSTISFDLTVANQANAMTFSSINASLRSKVLSLRGEPESDAQVIYIQSVHEVNEDGKKIPVKFVRNNDILRFNENVFKRQSSEKPTYTYKNDGIVIRPLKMTDYELTVVKYPRKVSLENNISTDLPPIVHFKIVAYALASSGVASRDDVMLQLQKVSGNGTDRQ